MATLNENIAQAVKDFDDIRDAIEYQDVEVPEDTPTSLYGEKIKEIDRGITPVGTTHIDQNGTHDVTNYASAAVNVPQGIFPEGTLEITENGEDINVSQYEYVDVHTFQPSGNIIIQKDGEYDVHDYDTANIETWNENYVINGNSLQSITMQPQSVVEIHIPEGVTRIESTAMPGNSWVQKIVIPDSVVDIDGYDPPAWSGPFQNCSNLQTVEFGNNVKTIGSLAFSNCSKLEFAELSPTVQTIGWEAFQNCTSLTSLIIPNSVTNIGSYAFSGCTGFTSIMIPDNVMNIGDYAFSDCTNLANITISNDSNITIGNRAFSNTAWYNSQPDGLVYLGPVLYQYKGNMPEGTILDIAEGTVSITNGILSNLDSLTALTFPSTLKTIPSRTIADCTNLSTVTFNNTNPLSVGENAFVGCTNIETVNVANLSAWCNSTFDGYSSFIYANPLSYGADLYVNQQLVTDLIVPNDVEVIGSRVFQNYSALTSITLNDGTESISNYAFAGCSNVSELTLCSTLKNIGYQAFSSIYNARINIPNIESWCNISLEQNGGGSDISNPLSYGGQLYTGDTLVSDIVIPEGITTINAYAFYKYSSLSTLSIADSVTEIQTFAFGETSVTSVNLGDGVETIGNSAFYSCTSLSSVSFGSNLRTIGYSAFENTAITTIALGNEVTTINGDAFNYCTQLASVSFGNKLKSIQRYAFRNDYNITSLVFPDSLELIGDGAFDGCTSLQSVTFGSHLKSIGDNAFNICPVVEVNIASIESWCSVEHIGLYPIMYTSHSLTLDGQTVTSVVIPDGITRIGRQAFAYCEQISEVVIPNSVVSIGEQAFDETAWLNNQPDGLIILGRVIYQYKGTIAEPTTIIVSDDIKSICASAFANQSQLSAIEFPDTLQEIGSNAFKGCTSLQNIVLPSSIDTVNPSTFENCSALESVEIAEGVKIINEIAFGGCVNLKTIILPKSLESVYFGAFSTCNALTDVYYTGSEEDWSQIEIANENTGLTSATIHYNYTEE